MIDDYIFNEQGLIYLATPYSHPDPYVRTIRFYQVSKVAGFLMNKGLAIFSPISHTHPIAEVCGLPKSWEFWSHYDKVMLHGCKMLLVLMLDGWKESVGVKGEIEIANELGIPVIYLEPKDIIEQ